MKFWLIAILALIIQESISTSSVMVAAYKGNHNLILFSLIFFVATISEIIIFYNVGKYLQAKKKSTKVVSWVNKYLSKANNFIGKKGKKYFLFLLSSSLFPPSATALIAAWLDISFTQIFLFIFLGNIVWYLASWMVVLGVT